MIKFVIFDLDGTLCDYDKARENARIEVNKILKLHDLDIEKYWDAYKDNEENLYPKFLNGEITIEEYRLLRNLILLEGKVGNAEKVAKEINLVYMENANKKIELFDDVLEILELLRDSGTKVVVLTNGPQDGQWDKFVALKLEQYVYKLYASDGIGVAKPDRRSYEHVLNDLGLKESEVIMIGDSIENDYIGSESIGIKSILIDRKNKFDHFKGRKIKKMLELTQFLTE